jgi:hypothetical protein
MRRAAAIAIAAAVGAGLATAYLALERPTPGPVGTDTGAAPSIAPPIAPDAAARAAPSGAEPTPPGAQPPPSADPPRPTEPRPAAADDPLEPPLELSGEHGDDFATSYLRVADRFRNEPRDPTAAVVLEREILDRFAAMPGLELTALEVECRTTTCRVRMVERPGAEFREVGGSGGFQTIGDGFGVFVGTTREAADGSTVFEWLLSRDASATQ